MKQFLLSEHRKWLVPLLLGVLVPLGGWFAIRILYPPVSVDRTSAAHSLQMEPQTYNDLRTMEEQLDPQTDLSNSQWQRLKTLLKEPNAHVQRETLGVMSQMRFSKYRRDALNLAHPFLDSRTLMLEVVALHVLRNLNDPNWRNEVNQRTNRPEPAMKEAVEAILQQKEGSR